MIIKDKLNLKNLFKILSKIAKVDEPNVDFENFIKLIDQFENEYKDLIDEYLQSTSYNSANKLFEPIKENLDNFKLSTIKYLINGIKEDPFKHPSFSQINGRNKAEEDYEHLIAFIKQKYCKDEVEELLKDFPFFWENDAKIYD